MKELVEARTPTSRSQPQSPKLGGCVGVFFNFFDWNKRLHGSRLFSKRLPAERPNRGVRPGVDEKLTAAKLLLIADESRVRSPHKDGAAEKKENGVSLSGAKGGVLSPPKRVPGVVARLMGLESLPINISPCSTDGNGAHSRRNSYDDRSQRAGLEAKLFTQEAIFVADQSRGDKGLTEVKKSPGRGNVVGPVRRSAGGDTVLPSTMGRKGSPMNEGVRKSPKKRSPPKKHFHGGYSERRRSTDGGVGSGSSRSGALPAKLGPEESKQGMSKTAALPRRPILVPSKNHNKVGSPNRSPIKMGSKSAAILLEAAQKILEPNHVKGRSSAGRPSPVKGPLQEYNPAPSVSVSGGRRALDFRGAFPTAEANAADESEASGTKYSQSFDERPRVSIGAVSSSSRDCWDSSYEDGATSDGSKNLVGPSSPGRPWHTVVTLRPASVSEPGTSYSTANEAEDLMPQEPSSRGRQLNPSPPMSKYGGSPGGSFRLQDRDTDFESVLSRYQESPIQDPGKKKEAFGKHDHLGRLTPEQKSELVRSFSVTETLHRSGSVKERVSRASSKMGSLLRSKSAREDKKLLGQAHFLECEPVEQDQVKLNSDAKVKVKRSPQSSASSKSISGSSRSLNVSAGRGSPTTEELGNEKKGSARFRAMKVLRGKAGRKQERDLSPPSSRVFPAAGYSGTESSPGSAQGSDPDSSGTKGGGGLLSYSRLFRAKKDKDAYDNNAEVDANPKKSDSYSMRSLLRRKPSSPEGPVVLRRGSRKIQADRPSTGQVMSMSPDMDEGYGRGSRGSSFDSNSGKLPLGCLVSELADVLEFKDSASPRKPFTVTNNLSTTSPSGVAQRLSEMQNSPSEDSKTRRLRSGDECDKTVGSNNESSNNDLFDEKTVDEDYERRKAQARLTRALQRGAVTQFRGDGLWCERPAIDEDPGQMFAAYIDTRINDSIEHDTFWRKVLGDSDDGSGNKASSPLNDYLLKRVKQLNSREYGLDAASKNCSDVNSTKSPLKCNEVIDALQRTSSVKYDTGSPLVPRVLIAEADSRDRACETACINDNGQPSPVSTLEAPFEDESSQDGVSQEGSSPKADVQLNISSQEEAASLLCDVQLPAMALARTQDVEDEQNVRVSDSRTAGSCDDTSRAVDTSCIMEAILDLSRIRQIDLKDIGLQEAADVSVVQHDDEVYITDILRRADFLGQAPKWHSGRLPIDPDLFSQLENQERGWSETESCRDGSCVTDNGDTSTSRRDRKVDLGQWLDRKLFFDCVNEALYVKLLKYVENDHWSMQQVPWVWPQPTGKQLVLQVHDQVTEWRNMDVEVVDTLVLYDMKHGEGVWTNFVQEVSEIALEIERHILRTMIEELVSDTLGSIPLPTTTLCVS